MDVQPAVARRRERHREARRIILDAAESLLVDAGYDGFSMRKLAVRCGYTAPSIYHYFGDKNGLIDALLEEVYQPLARRLERLPAGDDALDDVRAHFHELVRFGVANPTHYRLMTAARGDEAEPVPSAEEARALFERPFEALAAAGRLRGEVDEIQQALWCLMHGLVSLCTSRPDVDWRPSLAEIALEGMLEGLVKPAPRAARKRR